MNPNKKLKDIVTDGIAVDLFDAEEVFTLEEFIGKNAGQINRAKFDGFFDTFQQYFLDV